MFARRWVWRTRTLPAKLDRASKRKRVEGSGLRGRTMTRTLKFTCAQSNWDYDFAVMSKHQHHIYVHAVVWLSNKSRWVANVCLWNAMCLAILIKRYISFGSSPEIQDNLAVGTCQKQRQKHKLSSYKKFAIVISFFLCDCFGYWCWCGYCWSSTSTMS